MSSDIPFGSEFSPSQIDLPTVLEIAMNFQGDGNAIQDPIRERFFSEHGGSSTKSESNRKTLAYNCYASTQSYGLIDRDGYMTDIGADLHGDRGNLSELYTKLARHILLALKGMQVIEAVRDITLSGEKVSQEPLEKALRRRGLNVPHNTRALPTMRLWFAKAGVVRGEQRGSWLLDEAVIKGIVGLDLDEIAALQGLDREQKAFLRALASIAPAEPIAASKVAEMAEACYAVTFRQKSFGKDIVNSLRDAGWITMERATEGRGGKSPLISPTSKLVAELVEPLLAQNFQGVDSSV